MRAFVLDRYGAGQPLRLAEVPDPAPGDEDVLIEVHAAGLNPLDSKVRDGHFKVFLPYRTPLILGHDVAGKVIQVGKAVRGFAVGDAVYARPRDGRIGTLAERIAVPAGDVALKPARLSMTDAASLPLTALTAWQALVERGQVKTGDKVLIHAGAGGFGVVAIQLARYLGASVATTVSPAGAELVRSLGAETLIDYGSQDFTKVLSGHDVVISSLDEPTLERSVDVLKPGGVLISLTGPPDPPFARDMNLSLPLRLLVAVLSRKIRRRARARSVDYQFLFMRADGDQLSKITALVETGAIRPVLDRVFAFEDTSAAFAYLDQGHAKGKVVVEVRQEIASKPRL